MSNPYVVGGWVRGASHYGRRGLISHLLDGPNNTLWVVGTRRTGKTSLLRQLEALTLAHPQYVPLFLDLQGISTRAELNQELYYALEEVGDRFSAYGLDVAALKNEDEIGLLRAVRRQLLAANRVLLLLIDEAEALVNIGQADARLLQRLRKMFLIGAGLRVVMVSTKILLQLNDQAIAWDTSPFLNGFAPRNLTGLDPVAAEMLIRQSQSAAPVTVSDHTIDAIREETGDHPYLMQMICQRLWQEDNSLREVTPTDLIVDDMLAGFFEHDYRFLSAGERRILLTVSRAGRLRENEIRAATGLSEPELVGFVFGLIKLGYLRVSQDQLVVGNHLLGSWLKQNDARLEQQVSSAISDDSSQRLLHAGRREEMQMLQDQLTVLRSNLAELELQRVQFGIQVPLSVINGINQTRRDIARLEDQLSNLADGLASPHTGFLATPHR